MNITPINNANPNFNGKIITKGAWTQFLWENFNNNPEVIKLASGKNDIIAKMSRKYAGVNDMNHFVGEEIYKLTLKTLPEKANIFDRIKFWLTPPVKVTKAYHCESSMKRLFERRIDANRYAKKLNIDI